MSVLTVSSDTYHTRPLGVSIVYVSPIGYNSNYNKLKKEEQIMTITYSIWQGSTLLSVNNIAHEAKAIDHLIDTLNASNLASKVKFSANVMKVEVSK